MTPSPASGRKLSVRAEAWPIRGSFRIARGAKNEAHVIVAEIASGTYRGRGECVPYGRYGETLASVTAALDSVAADIEGGLSRDGLQQCLAPGAARNALDCALLDLEAKETGRSAASLLGLPPPGPLRTAYTLSLDTPSAMAAAAQDAVAKGYGLLKLKVAGAGDLERVEAIRARAPHARIIVDANEGWTLDDLVGLAPVLYRLGVELIEQPLPADADEALSAFASPVPLCADESCHSRADLVRVAGRYSHINIKLDKAGGLTEALALARAAKDAGLGLMIGCMVSTSLSMAPASFLGGLAEFVDLDGPLLLAHDRHPRQEYRADILLPPSPELWG